MVIQRRSVNSDRNGVLVKRYQFPNEVNLNSENYGRSVLALNREMSRLGLNGDPAQIGEFRSEWSTGKKVPISKRSEPKLGKLRTLSSRLKSGNVPAGSQW